MRCLVLLVILSTSNPLPCPPSQRYDASFFPPRCIACPRIVPRPVPLNLINTTAVQARRSIQKFSPGLPQNNTCGCWRANQTLEVALNASWIVSGLTFNSNRGRWLKSISVQASDDNVTFLDWGAFDFSNFTHASMAIFSYPLRARFFRISVFKYENHHVHDTTGFPVAIGALVSTAQPFGCDCPMLSSGECCPFANMSVHNDTCKWCMDPSGIDTIMVNGCGQCKQGTFKYMNRCFRTRPSNVVNRLEVAQPYSNGVVWTASLELVLDQWTTAWVFLSPTTGFRHPCTAAHATPNCTMQPVTAISAGSSPFTNPNQYVQFDRGRLSLNMTREAVFSWTECSLYLCSGFLSTLFVTLFPDGSLRASMEEQPVHFKRRVPALRSLLAAQPPLLNLAYMEVHRLAEDTWGLRIAGIRPIWVQWGHDERRDIISFASPYYLIPPPNASFDLKASDGVVTLAASVRIVDHRQGLQMTHTGIYTRIAYGLGLNDQPSCGDTDHVVIIWAESPQPIRLKRLWSTSSSQRTIQYTTPKGFLTDPNRVLDLSIACSQPHAQLITWLSKAVSILADGPRLVDNFIKESCSIASIASRAYWLLPIRSFPARSASETIQVSAEFA